MVRFDRSNAPRGPVVQGFTMGGFSVEGVTYHALLLAPEQAYHWHPPALEELSLDSLAPILELDPAPEFLILGTGTSTRFPPRALLAQLEERDIGVETMDSRAAARTWGLLRGEERWIAAALMTIG